MTGVLKLYPRDIRDRPAKEKINKLIDSVAGDISNPASGYDVQVEDGVLLSEAGGRINLHTAVGNKDKRIIVKRIGNKPITVYPVEGQTIDKQKSITLNDKYMALEFISDNANWWII